MPKVGDVITAEIRVTLPVPVHGLSCEVLWGANMQYIEESFFWGDMPVAEQTSNATSRGRYIERALKPADTPFPAGIHTLATLELRCAAAGHAVVELANMQAGVYSGEEIEQLGVSGKAAALEIVLDGGPPVVLFEVVII